jgi:hypothetical protein
MYTMHMCMCIKPTYSILLYYRRRGRPCRLRLRLNKTHQWIGAVRGAARGAASTWTGKHTLHITYTHTLTYTNIYSYDAYTHTYIHTHTHSEVEQSRFELYPLYQDIQDEAPDAVSVSVSLAESVEADQRRQQVAAIRRQRERITSTTHTTNTHTTRAGKQDYYSILYALCSMQNMSL